MEQPTRIPTRRMYAVGFTATKATAPGRTAKVAHVAMNLMRFERLLAKPAWAIVGAGIVNDRDTSKTRTINPIPGWVENKWRWYGMGDTVRAGERLELTVRNTTRRRLRFFASALAVVQEGR